MFTDKQMTFAQILIAKCLNIANAKIIKLSRLLYGLFLYFKHSKQKWITVHISACAQKSSNK